MGDEETQNRLQTDLGTLQEEWDNLHSLLGRRMDLTEAIVKVLCQLPCQNCTYYENPDTVSEAGPQSIL